MKIRTSFVAALAVAAMASAPAIASSSKWFEMEGARIRLVTSGQPDASGKLRGVLDIELKPGWKTYWRDPGNSGVPPQIDISASRNVSAAELAFPAPHLHDDGYAKWAGYDQPVRLPVTFDIASPDQAASITADIFLGVCESICVPVQARLELDPASDPGSAENAAVVTAAFAALPTPARPDFGAEVTSGGAEDLSITATSPGAPEAVDLFLAGTDGYFFGTPERHVEAGKAKFVVKVLERPKTKPAGNGIPYTLSSPAGAVDGFLPYP